MKKPINWTLIACIAAAAIVVFPLGHELLYGSAWSYSAPLKLLAATLEGLLSAVIGYSIYWLFIGRRKTN